MIRRKRVTKIIASSKKNEIIRFNLTFIYHRFIDLYIELIFKRIFLSYDRLNQSKNKISSEYFETFCKIHTMNVYNNKIPTKNHKEFELKRTKIIEVTKSLAKSSERLPVLHFNFY